MRHGVPLFIMDYNGTLLSSTLPKDPVNGPLKIAQIEAYCDPAKRFYIAKKLVEAKAQRTVDVLGWLAERYGKFNPQTDLKPELERLHDCASLPRLLSIEGRIADIYWRYIQNALPAKFGFTSRMHESHQMNASDPANALLNYGYAILESVCRKALNSVGLEPTIGFLHEARQVKYSLVYDLMEPYRWLVDTTIVECLEYERFGKKDFYRLDSYVLRLKPEAVKKLQNALRFRFNSTVDYRCKRYNWDVIIRLKAQELARYLLDNRPEMSFKEPEPFLQRNDSTTIREAIISLSSTEARELGIPKSSLHYLRKNALAGKAFKVRKKTRTRLLEGCD
jgi:CRISPR-associated protein Cas1